MSDPKEIEYHAYQKGYLHMEWLYRESGQLPSNDYPEGTPEWEGAQQYCYELGEKLTNECLISEGEL